MMDTWIVSGDALGLAALCADYPNVLGPTGRDGLWYACIRTLEPVALPAGCAPAEPETAVAILGVWA